jgi:hypothetical protein
MCDWVEGRGGTFRDRSQPAMNRPGSVLPGQLPFELRSNGALRVNTGYRVQGFIAEDVSDEPEDYRTITCLACRQVYAATFAEAAFDL